MDSASIMN